MKRNLCFGRVLLVLVPFLTISSPASAILANRVYVSARFGNDAGPCVDVNAPCRTLAAAVPLVAPEGAVIVLDSGGYGPVTITQSVTIEAAAGAVAFVHPPSGNAITVSAGLLDRVILRGLTLNSGSGSGVEVDSVGTLNIENCSIANFTGSGILMLSPGRLNVIGTSIKDCTWGIQIWSTTGLVQTGIDHCHLDGNIEGFVAKTTPPGSSTTTATYSTANNNLSGWVCGASSDGLDVLNLEFCSGSENFSAGLFAGSNNAQSVARYSNCVFANNTDIGAQNNGFGTVESRGNSTITGNGIAPTAGTISSFSPM